MFYRLISTIRHPLIHAKDFMPWVKSSIPKILWQICVPISLSRTESVHVDLGSGNTPRNPFGATRVIGTDFHSNFISPAGIEFVKVDLTRKLPFADSSLDSISAYDVLEHIPRWERVEEEIVFPFVLLMNEIHRCLKPGGIFLGVTPAFPSATSFQDPTHVNFISVATVGYFTGSSPLARELEYGFKESFNLRCQTWVHGSHALPGPSSQLNLEYQSLTEKAKFIFSFRNREKLFKLWKANMLSKPSHLLWILEKPANV